MELLTTKELCDRLKISRWQLRRKVENGELKPKTHFIDLSNPSASKRSYRWKIEAIIETFAVPVRHRKS